MARHAIAWLGLALLVCSGCKTAEIAVNHQITGLHVVAKFATADRQVRQLPRQPDHCEWDMSRLTRLPNPAEG
jgi:hypothetical protein